MRTVHGFGQLSRYGLKLLGLLVVAACSGDSTRPHQFDDTTPPRLTIVLPAAGSFDSNGDGLVDLHAEFADTASGIDVRSVRVRSLRGVNGSADATSNLVDTWSVEQFDTTKLILNETLAQLLHDGDNRLEISVADRAGNRATDTISFTLPSGQLMTTLRSGGSGHFTTDAVLCDDGLIYMTPANAMMVVDPQAVRILTVQPHPTYIGDQRYLACFPGDPMVYAGPDGFQFDRLQRQWTRRSILPGGWHAIARSRREARLMYMGVDGPGVIAEVVAGDTIQRRRIPIPKSSFEREQVTALAVLRDDAKLYMTRIEEGGILVVDPITGEILKRIKISGPNWSFAGRSDALELSHDDHTLYAAVLDGDPRGVAAIDTRTDEIRAFLPLPDYAPLDLALSPSGRRLFVTVTRRLPGLPANNVLVDVERWRVIQEFARPQPEGQLRWDNAIVFRPDGKLVFVGHDLDVDVYLNRE